MKYVLYAMALPVVIAFLTLASCGPSSKDKAPLASHLRPSMAKSDFSKVSRTIFATGKFSEQDRDKVLHAIDAGGSDHYVAWFALSVATSKSLFPVEQYEQLLARKASSVSNSEIKLYWHMMTSAFHLGKETVRLPDFAIYPAPQGLGLTKFEQQQVASLLAKVSPSDRAVAALFLMRPRGVGKANAAALANLAQRAENNESREDYRSFWRTVHAVIVARNAGGLR